MKTGQSQFALDVSPLLVQKFRHSVPLWVHRLRLLVVCGEDAETILSQLKDATKILNQVHNFCCDDNSFLKVIVRAADQIIFLTS